VLNPERRQRKNIVLALLAMSDLSDAVWMIAGINSTQVRQAL
jgi:hypothetical protein